MKLYKIVLLDLGGVVFQSTGVSNEKIQWEIISQLNWKYGNDLSLGKDLFPDFMEEYNQLTRQQISGPDFLKSVFDTLEMNRELVDFLGKHFAIIIVSDNYRENIEYISRRFDFDGWSEQQIYSFDYGMLKTDPAFFERLLTDLEYDTEEMIYIDDSPDKLESAKKYGIEGICFKDNFQIKEALKQYL